MDRENELTYQSADFSLEAFRDLEKRLEKAEGKLSKAKARAQATMQEIWQLDHRLKEEEERASKAESRLMEVLNAGGCSTFSPVSDRESRVDLQDSESGADSSEVDELQKELDKLKSKLLEVRAEKDETVAALRLQLDVLQDRTKEQSPGGSRDFDEQWYQVRLDAMRIVAHEAEERVVEAERKLGGVLTSADIFDEQLQDVKTKLREAEERALEWEERFHHSQGEQAAADRSIEEHSNLLQEKVEELSERLRDLESVNGDLEADKEKLDERLTETASLLRESQSKLQESYQTIQSLEKSTPKPQAVSLGSISLDIGDEAMSKKLQEAYKKTREAELKASQIEIQLQKAMVNLKEYEQRANESDRETQRLAFQDSLTGLPNLNLIRQYLDFTVKQVQRYKRASALLVLDIDRFKLINDAMGMKAGDELLVRMTERLQGAIRESDALGRRGEDEFLILLSELFTGDDSVSAEQKTHMIRQSIAIVVNRISESFSLPFLIQGQKFYVRVSIGVSICPNDADTPQAMLEHADCAMYHAKENGRGRCVFYNAELHKKQERRLAMESQLRLAMERGEFSLLYQPIIEVTKGKGQVVGVEALLRWNHRMDGVLLPHQFLPVAEETGVIVPLGQWVFRQACWQLRQWLASGTNLFMAINVSKRQIMQADLAEVVLGSIEEFGLQPGLVFVEIAEGGSVEEVDLVERNIVSLGKMGIRISIDDFGSGYNSLSRLDMQHVQFLKIDPSLVAGVQQDKTKANLCEGVVRLAQSLNIKPLAEGVETMAQAKFLSKIGCQFMQGFYLHEPVSASDIAQLIKERRVWKF